MPEITIINETDQIDGLSSSTLTTATTPSASSAETIDSSNEQQETSYKIDFLSGMQILFSQEMKNDLPSITSLDEYYAADDNDVFSDEQRENFAPFALTVLNTKNDTFCSLKDFLKGQYNIGLQLNEDLSQEEIPALNTIMIAYWFLLREYDKTAKVPLINNFTLQGILLVLKFIAVKYLSDATISFKVYPDDIACAFKEHTIDDLNIIRRYLPAAEACLLKALNYCTDVSETLYNKIYHGIIALGRNELSLSQFIHTIESEISSARASQTSFDLPQAQPIKALGNVTNLSRSFLTLIYFFLNKHSLIPVNTSLKVLDEMLEPFAIVFEKSTNAKPLSHKTITDKKSQEKPFNFAERILASLALIEKIISTKQKIELSFLQLFNAAHYKAVGQLYLGEAKTPERRNEMRRVFEKKFQNIKTYCKKIPLSSIDELNNHQLLFTKVQKFFNHKTYKESPELSGVIDMVFPASRPTQR